MVFCELVSSECRFELRCFTRAGLMAAIRLTFANEVLVDLKFVRFDATMLQTVVVATVVVIATNRTSD